MGWGCLPQSWPECKLKLQPFCRLARALLPPTTETDLNVHCAAWAGVVCPGAGLAAVLCGCSLGRLCAVRVPSCAAAAWTPDGSACGPGSSLPLRAAYTLHLPAAAVRHTANCCADKLPQVVNCSRQSEGLGLTAACPSVLLLPWMSMKLVSILERHTSLLTGRTAQSARAHHAVACRVPWTAE